MIPAHLVIEFYEISDFEKSGKSPIGYNSKAGNSINIPKNHEFEPLDRFTR
jgi:hypothetical protein